MTVVGLVGCAGCDRDGSGDVTAARRSRTEPIRVVAISYSAAQIAQSVGGNNVSVDWFRENHQGSSAWNPSDDRRAQLRAAEIVITSSALPWSLEGAEDSFRARQVIRLDDLIAPTPQPTIDAADAAFRESAFSPVGYEWLDPRAAKALANRVAARIAVLEPNWREQADASARALADAIDAVVADAWPAPPATTAPSRGAFLSLDPGYNAFARAFGFQPIELSDDGPLSLPLSRSSARAITAKAKESGATVIFIPGDTPPGLVRDLQYALGEGIRVEPLDAFGSSAARGPRSYVEVLRYNLLQLQKALPAKDESA